MRRRRRGEKERESAQNTHGPYSISALGKCSGSLDFEVFESGEQLKEKPSGVVPLILLALVLTGATGGFLYYQQASNKIEEQAVLTDEGRAYLQFLQLSDDTGMAAREDALGQTLLEITGSVTNNGEQTLEMVEVNVVFLEINGVEIDRQRSQIVNRRTGPLEPGETQDFRLPFDNISEDWNQAFPKLFISQIHFQ